MYTTLVLDLGNLHMNHRQGHGTLCTEPSETEQAVYFAFRIKSQNFMEHRTIKRSKAAVKNEPVYAVKTTNY